MRFDLRGLTGALLLGVVAVAACSAPDQPTYAAAGSRAGRTPPPASDAPADTTGGTTSGGTTTGSTTAGGGDAAAPFTGECTEDKVLKPDPACAASWAAIFAKMQDQGAWKCSQAGCHKAQAPVFPTTDAAATWNALRKIKPVNPGQIPRKDVPYINPCSKEPNDSFILANFKGKTGGSAMPIGIPASAADIANLETWVRCGSPLN